MAQKTAAGQTLTGCRFNISPMSGDFVSMILGAIKHVDTKKIWSATDALSTVYRGKRIHVMDCLKACFVHLNDGKTHAVMEAAVSQGDPEDSNSDSGSFLAKDDVLLNNTDAKFTALGKIAFYPLGIADYMDHIAQVFKLARDRDLLLRPSHQAPVLSGGINDLFDYFNAALTYAEQHISRSVLQITLSVNSPSVIDR